MVGLVITKNYSVYTMKTLLTVTVLVITLMAFSFVTTPSILSPKLPFPLSGSTSPSPSSSTDLTSALPAAYAQGANGDNNNTNSAIAGNATASIISTNDTISSTPSDTDEGAVLQDRVEATTKPSKKWDNNSR